MQIQPTAYTLCNSVTPNLSAQWMCPSLGVTKHNPASAFFGRTSNTQRQTATQTNLPAYKFFFSVNWAQNSKEYNLLWLCTWWYSCSGRASGPRCCESRISSAGGGSSPCSRPGPCRRRRSAASLWQRNIGVSGQQCQYRTGRDANFAPFQTRRHVRPAALHALRCTLSPRRVWDRGGGDASARSDGRERREPVPRSGGSNGEQLRLRRPGGQQPCSLGGVRRPARAVAQVGVRGVVRSWRMDLSVEGHFAFFAPESHTEVKHNLLGYRFTKWSKWMP